MGTYDEAYQLKKELQELIKEALESNEDFKRCIKARKAIVTTVPSESTNNKVGVKFIADDTELFFPYNNKFLVTDFKVGMTVSVWYSYSINNGIVTEDGSWTKTNNLSVYVTEDSLTTTLTNYATTEGGESSSFSYTLTSSNFKLTSNDTDVFVCDESGVVIHGTIYADDGKIGGLVIANSGISSSNGNFSISSDGELKATGATISGEINTESGKIGGFDIESTYLNYNGKMLIDGANGSITFYKDTKTIYYSYANLDYQGLGSLWREVAYSDYPSAKIDVYAEKGIDMEYRPSSSETTKSFKIYFPYISGTTTYGYRPVVYSSDDLYFDVPNAVFCGNINPNENDSHDIGTSDCMWKSIYVADRAFNGSDRKLKTDIEPLEDSYTDLFDNLKPVKYKLKKGNTDHYHTGFIAQEVEEAIAAAGLQNSDFAAYNYDEKSDTRCLAYNEFIALCVKEIQDLKKEVNELKKQLEK